jgi:hypothetical protein
MVLRQIAAGQLAARQLAVRQVAIFKLVCDNLPSYPSCRATTCRFSTCRLTQVVASNETGRQYKNAVFHFFLPELCSLADEKIAKKNWGNFKLLI